MTIVSSAGSCRSCIVFLSTVFLKVKSSLVRFSSTYYCVQNEDRVAKRMWGVRERGVRQRISNISVLFIILLSCVYVSPKTSVRYPLFLTKFFRSFAFLDHVLDNIVCRYVFLSSAQRAILID